jgi:hypothetical protein
LNAHELGAADGRENDAEERLADARRRATTGCGVDLALFLLVADVGISDISTTLASALAVSYRPAPFRLPATIICGT